jgi:protoheme IX farnesyltransferase
MLLANSGTAPYFSPMSAYWTLLKPRLSMLVVISTLLSFVYAIDEQVKYSDLFWLGVFGFFITGAANAFNQVIEKELDAKMDRTKRRPLPAELLFPRQSAIFSSVLLFAGLLGLTLVFNPLASGLSFISFVLYVFVYTPLKSRTPLAVLVGAFPGALPVLVGCVAASGQLFPDYLLLFAIQFFWQFPHFWAIAWVLDEDYQKAGFRLLPFGRGKDAYAAYYIFIYTVALVLVSLFPVFLQLSGLWYFGITILLGFGFLAVTLIHLKKLSNQSARRVMFYSFFYLPVVQLLLAIDKI